ncbi:glycerophosphodiester phosphodiesterase family protein [Spirosoma utsteinense]|uniref:Glycerophosphoryl diester phosphodiesterase n=1 Tax=Spirosoma utsteinense TaxID=2585773 RepID=A0ABR6W4J0_9BACT|nr:glycerophosphodiester phosphodiesterase family protein [Spirosoma utsteinense]MBC3785445.1 glycerophosphoryl diester phosphodiesterase [Spirosoma utsteinense]MBC3791526.1 glycerophosphoryl diester phosphodiesterase [Spirosoma utsteinense]
MRSILLIFCMIATAFVSSTPPAFDLQGHRGCRGLMPENTVPAFIKALELGVTTLELDVVISHDQQVVVSHEPYFNAAFSIKPDGSPVSKKEQKELVLYRMEYAEIKRYDVGSNGNPAYPEQQKLKTYKPLLSEVIEQAEAYRTAKNLPAFSYNIELKSEPSEYNKSQPEPAVFCELVQAIIRKQLTPDRVVIQSFDFAMLTQWKQQASKGNFPLVRLAALVENLRSPEKNLEELGFTPDIYSPNYRLLSADKVARLHEKGIKVIPWTVNQRDDMVQMKRWGVDGLITDYPDRALSL